MTKTYTWAVEGERTMHCGGCAATIEFTLARLAGVERVKADFHTQRIKVEANDPLDRAQVVSELAELDYSVREVSGDDEPDH